MNEELYDFICNAKINESLKKTTHIILTNTEGSYKEVQETFINIVSYICSFLSVNDAYLLNDVIFDLYHFIQNENMIIKEVYILICKLCILCDINLKNPCIKVGTIGIKQLRTKVIDIFDNGFKLEQLGLTNFEHVLSNIESDTYDLVLKIVTGYVYSMKNIENTSVEESHIIDKTTNKLRDSVDYILRKNFIIENKIQQNDNDIVWFLWGVLLGLFGNDELKIMFHLFRQDYNKKKKSHRKGILYGVFVILVFQKKRDISRKWNKNELNIIQKMQDISQDLYKDIKQEILAHDDTIIKNQCNKEIPPNGLEYLCNLRPQMENMRLEKVHHYIEDKVESKIIRCKRFS